ncbi:hypothetical protein [Bacillus altitudinis]|uniref:hypothetical protein n=1 Tax=Bacillus altitudinis TaxID=293387 RepID=UPI0030C7F3CB
MSKTIELKMKIQANGDYHNVIKSIPLPHNLQNNTFKLKIVNEETKKDLLPYVKTKEVIPFVIEKISTIPVQVVLKEGDVYIVAKE